MDRLVPNVLLSPSGGLWSSTFVILSKAQLKNKEDKATAHTVQFSLTNIDIYI